MLDHLSYGDHEAEIARAFESTNATERLSGLDLAMQHYPKALGVVLRQNFGELCETDQTDAVNRAFHGVWQDIREGPLRVKKSVFAMLVHIAKRRAIDSLRSNGAWRKRHLHTTDFEPYDREAEQRSPWEGLIEEDRLAVLKQCVPGLRGQQRLIGEVILAEMVLHGLPPTREELLEECARRGAAVNADSLNRALREIGRKYRITLKRYERPTLERSCA